MFSGPEFIECKIRYGLEMFYIASGKYQVMLNGGCGHDGIARPQSGGERILLNVNRCPMAYIFSQRKGGKIEIPEKAFCVNVLIPVLSALEEFHVRQR